MRETVDERAVYKFGYMLETPRILRYEFMSHGSRTLAAWTVTMRQVRTISRKDWTPTSQVSWMEKAPSTLPSNGTRAREAVGNSCLSSTSAKRRSVVRSST